MNFYDQLIDKALEIRDYEWAKELVKQKDEYKPEPIKEKPIYPKAKALEDLNDTYVVKEEHGLRNIIFTSEEDILKSNIVELKNYQCKDGIYAKQNNNIEYFQYDEGNTYVLKYYILGYSNGVKLGNNLSNLGKHFSENDIDIVNLIKKYGLK